jgi:recombination protein RecT
METNTKTQQQTSTAPAQATTTDLVKEKQEGIKTRVQKTIAGYLEKGTLHLPADYSVDNAIHNAFLKLVIADGKPLLNCNPSSIQAALVHMIVQGMDVGKEQCYLINYGGNLTYQRSYHGDEALVKRIKPGCEVYREVVRQGDELEIEIKRGRKYVTHRTKRENQNNPIVEAYCGIIDENGEDLGVELMTVERIKKSWSMSKTYREGGNGTHQKFDDKMILRTVVRAKCLPIIRTASDAHLRAAIEKAEADEMKAAMALELAENANGDTIDIAEYNDVSDQAQEPEAETTEPVAEAPATTTDGLPASLD